jgi:tetratricopeptide (TPR) repeat protein
MIVADLEFVRRFAPVDPRAVSLLGETALREGNVDKAKTLFSEALAQSPTELHSLKRLIALELGEGQIGSALSRMNVLLKRWPGRFGEFSEVFPPLMATLTGYNAVLVAAAQDAAWRGRLLSFLASDTQTAVLAYRLLLDLRDSDPPVADSEVDRVITLLMSKGQSQLAYQAYVLTRAYDPRENIGYVTNSTFGQTAASSPFDWSLSRLAGMDAAMVGEGEGPGGTGGLRIEFRRKPVKGTIAQQMLMLPTGAYELLTESTTRGLETPKGLTWTVTCMSARAPLAALVVEPGRYDRRPASIAFNVPAEGCEAQRLRLSTGVVAPSMRYRYEGSLIVHRTAVRQTLAE